MLHKVLLVQDIPQIEKIAKAAEVEIIRPANKKMSRQEIETHLSSASGILSTLDFKWDEDLLSKAKKLKVISNYAVGVNNIDLLYCRDNGIAIGHTPGCLTDATADLTLALLLAVSRQIPQSFQSIGEGKWKEWSSTAFLGPSLSGKTLGIVGMGRIGRAVAKRAEAFGLKVEAFTRSQQSLPGIKFHRDLKTLCNNSHFLTLHCPLTDQTKNLITEEILYSLPKGSVFINTARGEMHDESLLLKALEDEHLWGVGLDVTSPEPMAKESPLLKHPRVVVTPHIGSANYETRDKMAEMTWENLLAGVLEEELPFQFKS